MLLCKEQKSVINVEGRDIRVSDKAANAYFYLLDAPIEANTVKMYLEFFLKSDMQHALIQFSDKELTQIVENGVKREVLDLFDVKTWDEIQE